MSTSTVPIGNPAGMNQANPALNAPARPMPMGASTPPAPIAGGTAPVSTNPYILGGGAPGTATSGSVPSSTPGAPLTPDQQQQQNLIKQWTDIYGKGTGGEMASEYQGMQGINSAAFDAYLQSMAPVWAGQTASFGQSMGAAGVSPNSTVEALGLSNLLSNQAATAAGVSSNMIMQNQQERLGLLTGTEQASAAEVASSGWDVFGQVIGDVGALAGDVLGVGGLGSISSLFGKGKGTPAYMTPGRDVGSSDMANIMAPASIPEIPMQTVPVGGF